MSNFDPRNKIQKKKEHIANLKNLKWKSIQSDLKSSISDWSLVEQKEPQKTPDEVQMDKVKSMIENIKDKLSQF